MAPASKRVCKQSGHLPAAPLPGAGVAGASAAACAARQAKRRCCALCCCAGSRGMRHTCFLAGVRIHSQAELVCAGTNSVYETLSAWL